jgi:hypothetical protein
MTTLTEVVGWAEGLQQLAGLDLPRFGGQLGIWALPWRVGRRRTDATLFPSRCRGQGSKTAMRRAEGASLTAAPGRKRSQHRFGAGHDRAADQHHSRALLSYSVGER